jgi:hypothetical protein
VVDDQPSKRNRQDCTEHRKSKPVSGVLAPHRITEAQQLWAGPLNHRDPIGTFFVSMKRRPEVGWVKSPKALTRAGGARADG